LEVVSWKNRIWGLKQMKYEIRKKKYGFEDKELNVKCQMINEK
jgi:hypothetical protein